MKNDKVKFDIIPKTNEYMVVLDLLIVIASYQAV